MPSYEYLWKCCSLNDCRQNHKSTNRPEANSKYDQMFWNDSSKSVKCAFHLEFFHRIVSWLWSIRQQSTRKFSHFWWHLPMWRPHFWLHSFWQRFSSTNLVPISIFHPSLAWAGSQWISAMLCCLQINCRWKNTYSVWWVRFSEIWKTFGTSLGNCTPLLSVCQLLYSNLARRDPAQALCNLSNSGHLSSFHPLS